MYAKLVYIPSDNYRHISWHQDGKSKIPVQYYSTTTPTTVTMTETKQSTDASTVQPEGTADVEKYASDSVTSKNEIAEDDSKFPTGLALWSILGPVTIAYFLVFLDMCVVSTATPAITQRFDSLVDVGWYGGAYQLGSSALQPLTGKIYSHFNIKVGHSVAF